MTNKTAGEARVVVLSWLLTRQHGCRCKRLPKELKTWQAYEDLRKHIDDLSECCPLLTAMKDEAMKKRHWDQICDVCQKILDMENENLKLKDIMALSLLRHREEIEVSIIHGPPLTND